MCKLLHKNNEQAMSFQLDVQFNYKHTNYSATLELEAVAAFASVPCGKCSKTTRSILTGIGATVPANDMDVNVLETTVDLPENDELSVLDAEYVFIIKNVDMPAEKIRNTDAQVNVTGRRELAELQAHAEKSLILKAICTGCFFETAHIENLLNE